MALAPTFTKVFGLISPEAVTMEAILLRTTLPVCTVMSPCLLLMTVATTTITTSSMMPPIIRIFLHESSS